MGREGEARHLRPEGLARADLPRPGKESMESIEIEEDPYVCCAGAHAIAILTEWDMFKKLDYQKIYAAMQKPAFIFDGRDVVDHAAMRKIGFEVWAVGKSFVPAS